MSWKAQILNHANVSKRAVETGDFSKFIEKKKNPKYSNDELKKMSNEFPEIKTVMEDQATYHNGIVDEHQSVTDDLESGHADKPTAIERVKAQGEKLKAESIANIDASTERMIALIEGLPEDQQQRAADLWESLGDAFMAFWSEVVIQVERIFEFVVEWLSQVWEQVRQVWTVVKGVFTQIWAWLGGLVS